MASIESLVGLPWQLAEHFLQAAGLSYRVQIGKNYEKFFSVIDDALYVTKIINREDEYLVLLHAGMVQSGFRERKDVSYAKVFLEQVERGATYD